MTAARPRVRGWLRHKIPGEDVEDLTQDILIKVWERRNQWDGRRDFWPWFWRITVNHWKTWLRDTSRDLAACSLEELSEQTPALGASPEEQVIRAEQRQELRQAIGELPAGSRQAIRMFYLEGWSCARIAEATGTTAPVVKMRLHRGRKLLRRDFSRGDAETRRAGKERP